MLSEPACTELTVILRHGCPLYSSRADMISFRINFRFVPVADIRQSTKKNDSVSLKASSGMW
jgi:hypothetical protein